MGKWHFSFGVNVVFLTSGMGLLLAMSLENQEPWRLPPQTFFKNNVFSTYFGSISVTKHFLGHIFKLYDMLWSLMNYLDIYRQDFCRYNMVVYELL